MSRLLSRAQDAWSTVAESAGALGATRRTLLVNPDSALCPVGWVGAVVLGESSLVVGPTEELLADLQPMLHGATDQDLVTPRWWTAQVPSAHTMGPAHLLFVDVETFDPPAARTKAVQVSLDSPDVQGLLRQSSKEDLEECAIGEVTSPLLWGVFADGELASICGYRVWPADIAHLSVLTRATARSKGFAQAAATAATAAALEVGLLPQWRARPEESRRVALALGYQQMGAQLAVTVG